MFYRPGKRFLSLRGFELVIMYSKFFGVFGLPYRLASLLIIGVLKVCATKNEETLSYQKGSGNLNFDHFDNTSVYSHMNRDIKIKLCVKCCGGENGEPLGHVACGYGTLMEHLKHLGLTDAIQRCENRKAKNVVFMHITCRVTISNDFQPFVTAGQLLLASVVLEAVVLPFRLYHEASREILYHEASREILTSSLLFTFFQTDEAEMENLHAH